MAHFLPGAQGFLALRFGAQGLPGAHGFLAFLAGAQGLALFFFGAHGFCARLRAGAQGLEAA
jgi:hypothetical protein